MSRVQPASPVSTRPNLLRQLIVALAFALALAPASAQKKYDPGASDTEIRIGQTKPYSGPASAYSAGGKVQAGFFEKLNSEGGVNGRKIKLISLDDAFTPPKTVEQTRKLVEQDEVLAVFNSNGTAANSAVQKYLNAKKVPQLFVSTGASKFTDPKNFHWTMGWLPTYYNEARAYARYVLQNRPNAKIAVLYQNDDFGKDYLNGLYDELGDKRKQLIVAESSFELTDPTVDSQMVTLKASGADTFFNISTAKFAAQAIRKAYDIGWKPLQFVAMPGSSVGQVMVPAGLEKGVGVITVGFMKDPDRSAVEQRSGDEGMARLHEEVLSGRRSDGLVQRLCVRSRADASAGAKAVRGRSDSRERDESGGEPQESRFAAAAARHPNQHQLYRLSRHPAGSAAALRRQRVGAFRRSDRELVCGNGRSFRSC